MFELLAIGTLLGLAWLWFDSVRVRELAIQAAKQTCMADGVQFLDETVSGQRMRLTRDDEGQVRIGRVYRFEYSDTGDNRRSGHITMLGDRVEVIHTAPRLVH